MKLLSFLYGRIRYFFIKGPFIKCLDKEMTDEVGEEFLELLLKLFDAARFFDPYLKKSMEGFNGRIQLRNENSQIRVLAEFKDNRLEANELEAEDELKPPPDATIIFKGYEALVNFLLPKGGRRNILRSLLQNELRFEGNFNYIYRFGFLATHVQLPIFRRIEQG